MKIITDRIACRAMALPRWQHHKYNLGYYYYYFTHRG